MAKRADLKIMACRECGEFLMPLSGSAGVCPNGHGKVRLGLSRSRLLNAGKLKQKYEWIDSLPVAERRKGKYFINGEPHEPAEVDHSRVARQDQESIGAVAASVKGLPRWFTKAPKVKA